MKKQNFWLLVVLFLIGCTALPVQEGGQEETAPPSSATVAMATGTATPTATLAIPTETPVPPTATTEPTATATLQYPLTQGTKIPIDELEVISAGNVNRLERIQDIGNGFVEGIELTKDGKKIVLFYSFKVELRDAQTLDLITKVPLDEDSFRYYRLSSEGSRFVARTDPSIVKVWNFSPGEEERVIDFANELLEVSFPVLLDVNDQTDELSIVFSTLKQAAFILTYNLTNGELLRRIDFPEPGAEYRAAFFDHDLLIETTPGSIVLYRLSSGERAGVVYVGPNCADFRISRDGEKLAAVCGTQGVIVSVDEKKVTAKINAVHNLEPSPDFTYLSAFFLQDYECNLVIYKKDDQTESYIAVKDFGDMIKINEKDRIGREKRLVLEGMESPFLYSADEQFTAFVRRDPSLQTKNDFSLLYRLEVFKTSDMIKVLSLPLPYFSPPFLMPVFNQKDTSLILFTSLFIKAINTTSFEEMANLNSSDGQYTAMIYSGRNNMVYTTRRQKYPFEYKVLRMDPSTGESTTLATLGEWDYTAHLGLYDDDKVLIIPTSLSGYYSTSVSSSSGVLKRIAPMSEGGGIRAGARGNEIHLSNGVVLTGSNGNIYELLMSPDGTRLVSIGDDGWIRLWDTGSGKQITRFGEWPEEKWHNGKPERIFFTPDSKYFAVNEMYQGNVRQLNLRDVATGDVIALLGQGYGFSITASPDSSLLAVNTEFNDFTVQIYSSETLEKIADLVCPGSTNEDVLANVFPLALAFSPDGTRLYAGTDLSGIYVWGVRKP